MTTRDMKRRMQAYRKGVSDMRERAIAAASQALNGIECECGSTDPETGTHECSLMVRGQDCLCSERAEEAEAIVERIRQITIEVDR
ncbi:hypothetical protein ASD52_06460 [Ensifer sp. Root142]|uniref:hypothetical protein n=1 Tax=Ensifer sp. Root142 TaxID=1736461 RepID=UPI00070FAF6F|nr:hypothetical protein [Ensifer sp. Root142]KQY71323.1 hypothetical protein ASD52_06460 [Ensifer sp. Root142]